MHLHKDEQMGDPEGDPEIWVAAANRIAARSAHETSCFIYNNEPCAVSNFYSPIAYIVGSGRTQMTYRKFALNAPLVSALTTAKAAVVKFWRVWRQSHRSTYRPEAYYMRGPGPKWREKHAGRVARP